ncbi:acetyl-CoA synthetase-like protein [Ceratobasidium sp. AG-I]|nr:acetyl-CoA synthetase-like protein [Ceratobasidium sp. AG-I]
MLLEGPARLENILEVGNTHHPSKSAISYLEGGIYKHVSFGELHARAHRLARVLQSRVSDSTQGFALYIGLFLGRSVEQVVAIFASFVVGAAYVPISLNATLSSFQSILDQTGLHVVVTGAAHRARLESLLEQVGRTDVVVVDVSDADESPSEGVQRMRGVSAQDAAYVLFSSGTTGTPKGIINSHSAVRTYCVSGNEYFRATGEDKWVRAAAYTFDASVEELFCPLSVGGQVIIQPDGALSSFPAYIDFLSQSGATIVSMTTALWHQFTSFVVHEKHPLPSTLRLIVIGGEAAMGSVLKMWRECVGEHPKVLNTYGATEATVSTTMWEGQDFDGSVLPIGRILKDYECYVLDSNTHQPVPRGEDGVLFVAGPGVAIGYLNPELTERKFVANPWAESPAYGRMYNTGDVVRVDDEGVYWFRGRLDLQVKIRGYLVELESIEACILSHPLVRDVAVIAADEGGTKALNAYVVQSPHPDSDSLPLYGEDLTEHCKKTLAPYEVPTRFFKIEKMPYTVHRKVDRRALTSTGASLFPFRDVHSSSSDSGSAFSSEVESTLADLWTQCLDGVPLDNLNAGSNLIHLGGHSLTMITLAAKIRTTMGVNVSAVELLQSPTLGRMARFFERQQPRLSSSARSSSTLSSPVFSSPGSSVYEPDSAPNVIPLQSARTVRPKAMLFVFHFIAGELEFLPQMVNALDGDGSLGLATYGIAWVPDQGLDTWDKLTKSYAASIASVAGSTPVFLLGWCFGGMLASSVARWLSGDVRVMLLNAPAPAEEAGIPLEPSDFPTMFVDLACWAVNHQGTDIEGLREYRSATKGTDRPKQLAKALEDAHIGWHESDRLVDFVRSHIEVPDRTTDEHLLGYILPLADMYDVLLDLHANHTRESMDTQELEKKVVLNLQYKVPHEGMERGLGWEKYEIIGDNHWVFGYLPEVSERIRELLLFAALQLKQMLRYVFRLIFGLVSLAVMLGYQALPTAALVMQERRSQEPTLPSNLTQDVLQVASAISPSCANLDSCIDLVTTVIPKCDQLGRDPGCWCANHDALHNCAMCMISPTDNQTTADQTEAAAAGHSGFHAACDAYAEIVNGTSGSLASNDTLGPIGKSHLLWLSSFPLSVN